MEAQMAELRHQISIRATPKKVFAALATEAGLRGWWTADTKADEKSGGKAEFGFDKHQAVYRMKIEKLDPGKQVIWSCHGDQPEWNGTVLTWDIVGDGDATTLRFTQGGWKSMSEMYAMCNSSWGALNGSERNSRSPSRKRMGKSICVSRRPNGRTSPTALRSAAPSGRRI
jgi:uncharacterized protein YndB with AHSA1/START domain